MSDLRVEKKAFSVTIHVTTEIAAPPERVWEILTDTAAYPEWNPFVVRMEGSLEPGSKVSTVRWN